MEETEGRRGLERDGVAVKSQKIEREEKKPQMRERARESVMERDCSKLREHARMKKEDTKW